MDRWPEHDPLDIEPFHIVWCDKSGINTGAAADSGILQGATISTVTWTVGTGLTTTSNSLAAITIHGVSYSINTVATIWFSTGTADTDYTVRCKITTSDSRTLYKSVILPVRTA